MFVLRSLTRWLRAPGRIERLSVCVLAPQLATHTGSQSPATISQGNPIDGGQTCLGPIAVFLLPSMQPRQAELYVESGILLAADV